MTQFADLVLVNVRFVVPADPVPLARPRVVKGHAYLPARSRDYRAEVQTVIKQTLGSLPPMTGAIRCRLSFYRRFLPTSRRFGDVDNHVKAVLDACNGLLLADDSCVVELLASKHQDTNFPRSEIAFDCIAAAD